MMSGPISVPIHFNNVSALQCKRPLTAFHIVHESIPVFTMKSVLFVHLYILQPLSQFSKRHGRIRHEKTFLLFCSNQAGFVARRRVINYLYSKQNAASVSYSCISCQALCT